MINNVLKNVESFVSTKCQQFNKLPDSYKARVIAKTIIVAAAVGLASGLVAGPALAVVGFTAAALYVGLSILDRISSSTAFKKVFADLGKDVKNKAEDLNKSIGRDVEDFFDSALLNNSKQANQKKAETRKIEDQNTGLYRSVLKALNEVKFTMSL